MSDVVYPTDYGLSTTDNCTFTIVNGYIKILSGLFNTCLTFRSVYFPNKITNSKIECVGDQFMINGCAFKCMMNLDTLIKMSNVEPVDIFESDTFEIGKLKCHLHGNVFIRLSFWNVKSLALHQHHPTGLLNQFRIQSNNSNFKN